MTRSNIEIIISQRKCILDLLRETCMLECKPIKTPMKLHVKLRLEDEKEIILEKYQKLLGKLIYLLHTRPNNIFSQFMYIPKEKYLEAIYRLQRYLIGILGMSLFFKKKKKDHMIIEVYINTDG